MALRTHTSSSTLSSRNRARAISIFSTVVRHKISSLLHQRGSPPITRSTLAPRTWFRGSNSILHPSILRRLGRMLQDRATPHSRVIIRHKVTTNISRPRNHGITLSRGTLASRIVIRHRITKILRDTRTPSNRDLHSRTATVRVLLGRSRADHLFITEILPTLSHSSRPPTELLVPNLHSKMLSRATVNRILTRRRADTRTKL